MRSNRTDLILAYVAGMNSLTIDPEQQRMLSNLARYVQSIADPRIVVCTDIEPTDFGFQFDIVFDTGNKKEMKYGGGQLAVAKYDHQEYSKLIETDC